jgi:hypothetical protein
LAGSAQAQLLNEDEPVTDLISASAVSTPHLTLESDFYNLGSILQLDRPEFDYRFTNTGNGLLVISRVQSTCGCTVPELTKKEFKPGESGTIHVKYDPSGKIGTQQKQIHVYSNDAERAEIALTLKADVSPVVLVEPRALNFNAIPKGEGRTTIIKIAGRTPDFAATFATLSRGEHMSLKVLDTKPVEINGQKLRQTEIEVTLAPTAPVGRLTDNLSIRTTDPREAVVFCPISADVQGDVKAEPSVLSFGVVRPGESFKGSLRVASRSNKPFKILSAEVRQPNTAQLQLEFTPEDPANPTVYNLTAQGTSPAVAEGVRAMPIQGYIVVTTDVDREAKVDIPFFVQPRLNAPTPPPARPGAVPPQPGLQPTAPQNPAPK